MSRQQVRFVKRVLYGLKRDFGVRGSLYHETVGAPNRMTGASNNTVTGIDIKRIVLLPEKTVDKMVRQLSPGGFFQVGDLEVLIDSEDLPLNYVISPEDYVVILKKHYNIISIANLIQNTGWYLQIRWTQQTPTEQIVNAVNKTFISFSQTISGAKV